MNKTQYDKSKIKTMIHDLYEIAKVARLTHKLLDDVVYKGKEYLGEVFIQDSNGCLWKVKVRYTGNRKRYLKISSQSSASPKIRASADNYKPSEYLHITPKEWENFYRLANNEQEVYRCVQTTLDRLVR